MKVDVVDDAQAYTKLGFMEVPENNLIPGVTLEARYYIAALPPIAVLPGDPMPVAVTEKRMRYELTRFRQGFRYEWLAIVTDQPLEEWLDVIGFAEMSKS
jgi:hypothetical protein